MDKTETEVDRKYPEHAKQNRHLDESKIITSFLEWASEKGYDFGRTITDRVAVFEGTEDVTSVHVATRTEITRLLAERFDIDLKRINAEKAQMIDDTVARSSIDS